MSEKLIPALAILLASALLAPAALPPASTPGPVRQAEYLAYAKASADWAWSHYDEIVAKWREGFDPNNVFGYRAPGGLLEMAAIYAHFFERKRTPNTPVELRKSS